jgi:phage nucleotide-binding protein
VTSELIRPQYLAGLPVLKAQAARQHVNMLIYGKSGVGKTQLAGSADAVPSMRKVLVVDVEGGTMTLSHSYPDVDVVRVKDWNEVAEISEFLKAGNHDYNTCIIDSLTEAQKFNMSAVMSKRILEREEKGETQDPDVPDMRAWGKNIEQIRKFVRYFRDLDMNTIFTALVKEDKNPRTGLIERKPYLSGKLADEVAAFLDIVVYYYVKTVDDEQKRLLLTQATDEYVAKDRTGKLPPLLEQPTLAEIMKYAIPAQSNNLIINQNES